MRDLPSGTVTFLFTDIEGSTRLLHELGAEEYSRALAEHRRILREAFGANQGFEVDTQGDAFFVAFPTAPGALGAAGQAIEGLTAGPIRVRMGIHTGTPHLGEEGYVGVDVHQAACIAACGHGGQVLVSASTAALVGTDGLRGLFALRLGSVINSTAPLLRSSFASSSPPGFSEVCERSPDRVGRRRERRQVRKDAPERRRARRDRHAIEAPTVPDTAIAPAPAPARFRKPRLL